jgi:hypothetical protein
MTRSRSRSRLGGAARWFALTAGVFVLASGGFRSSGITQGEFECEQAAAHLRTCCPDFPVRDINCNYLDGCGGPGEDPLFDVPTSQCLQQTRCEDLQASGTCERLAKIARDYAAQTDRPDHIDQTGLCP